MQEGQLLTAAILAHQGGWDEILLVATPIVAIIVILRVVKKRLEAAEVVDTGTGTDDADTNTDTGTGTDTNTGTGDRPTDADDVSRR